MFGSKDKLFRGIVSFALMGGLIVKQVVLWVKQQLRMHQKDDSYEMNAQPYPRQQPSHTLWQVYTSHI
jgi:hypothetical protein